ncbi:uncharacterized protein [Littorina saxatilis]|uniref:uncharacterized protein n=1 Tax=Littorina saxatilis TaxID=31220 RepID=UPI0038B52996
MCYSTMLRLSVCVGILASFWVTPEASYPPLCQRIDAAVRLLSSNKTMFFSQNQYIVHNDLHNAEEDVFSVSHLDPDFPANIDAAVNWFGKRKSFYFKGCYYYKVHASRQRQRLRSRRVSRLGLPCDVDAALNTDRQHVLVFKGCQYWTINRTTRRAVHSGNTSNLGLPCHLDAALTWKNGTSYVIKDDVIWALPSRNSPAYRSSLDDWNLCSWRICESNDTTRDNNVTHLGASFPCNGDERFCRLRFDQMTMAGSHNAGSGFDGGFGFLSCWVRNQYLSVLEQLRFGVRFLDVDTSWEHCGLLGTFHNFACGGPVCKMIKQIKRFLRENRHEVVTVNFNHEMQDFDRVAPALLRQITAQLGDDVNAVYRDVGRWPSLRDAITSNKRLFVIVDKRVASEMFDDYLNFRWIHSERLLHSTWRGDVNVNGHCQEVVENSQQQCRNKNNAPLLEVSIFGYSVSCVTTIADLCLPLVHNISRVCQGHRHLTGRAPNVLLVDYPERVARPELSVVWAAFLQNVRNAASLSRGACHVQVDAAVTWKVEEGEEKVLFIVGGRHVVYNWNIHIQEPLQLGASDTLGNLPATADAAFRRAEDPNDVCFVRGCSVTCFSVLTSSSNDYVNDTLSAWGLPCDVDAAFTRDDSTFLLKGCQYWQREASGHVTGPQTITGLGVPCNVSAVLQAPDGATYFFKGDDYYKYKDQQMSLVKSVLDWSADFLQC